MLFNSFDFAIFLPLVFVGYWFLFQKNIRIQNLFVVISSFVFYGWWDYRFLSLLLFSAIVDYSIGLKLNEEANQKKRKILLTISLCTNLGLLGFFKYYNFFITNFIETFSMFGVRPTFESLKIILPVGISFYTFQTMSYTIDVYRKRLVATPDFIAFLAFVSFFPQLVAGPIERATQLLPQFYHKRVFNNRIASDGLRQMLWGFFKKLVIADNCAIGVNYIFGNHTELEGAILLLGGFLFAFQIYCDFSGYSDIAIGLSRLFGFDLMRNFNYPYFSRDMAEFWRRWHISLSTWFRDYLYFPLGGSQGGNAQKIRNTFIIFIVSGFWHGANWTFIAWGFINACYFLPLLLTRRNRNHLDIVAKDRKYPTLIELYQMLSTFFLTVIAWIFFRSASISGAILYLKNLFLGLFDFSTWKSTIDYIQYDFGWTTLIFIVILICIEWIQRAHQHALFLNTERISKSARWIIYASFIFSILVFGAFEKTEFIYFQF